VFNKVVTLLSKAGLGFTQANMSNDLDFIHTVTDCIWYIDLHLDTMAECSCSIPVILQVSTTRQGTHIRKEIWRCAEKSENSKKVLKRKRNLASEKNKNRKQ
jgi:hypothetical protein